MIPVIFSVVSQAKPFTVATSKITTFPPNPDDGTPIIGLIDSPELHAFRKTLCETFDKSGVEYNKKYPDYRPHVTLGYSSDPLGGDKAVNLAIPVVEWGAHELVLWGGDSGDNRIIITFPFSVATTKAAMHKAFVQLAKNWSLALDFDADR